MPPPSQNKGDKPMAIPREPYSNRTGRLEVLIELGVLHIHGLRRKACLGCG